MCQCVLQSILQGPLQEVVQCYYRAYVSVNWIAMQLDPHPSIYRAQNAPQLAARMSNISGHRSSAPSGNRPDGEEKGKRAE